MKYVLYIVVASAIQLASMAGAHAHAFLDHASPSVGSTVHAPPQNVRLWFTEALEPAFSTVKVVGANGDQVDKGDKQLDAADKTILQVSLPNLPVGTYKVIWRVLSVDGHVTEGDFKFQVAP